MLYSLTQKEKGDHLVHFETNVPKLEVFRQIHAMGDQESEDEWQQEEDFCCTKHRKEDEEAEMQAWIKCAAQELSPE